MYDVDVRKQFDVILILSHTVDDHSKLFASNYHVDDIQLNLLFVNIF